MLGGTIGNTHGRGWLRDVRHLSPHESSMHSRHMNYKGLILGDVGMLIVLGSQKPLLLATWSGKLRRFRMTVGTNLYLYNTNESTNSTRFIVCFFVRITCVQHLSLIVIAY